MVTQKELEEMIERAIRRAMTEKPKIAEKLEIEPTISDAELTAVLKELEREEEFECPCGYRAKEKFDTCPRCGEKIAWN